MNSDAALTRTVLRRASPQPNPLPKGEGTLAGGTGALPVLACVVIVVLTAGCGGDGRVPVGGQVVVGDAPAANLFIKLEPQGAGEPAWGYTDEQGRFKLSGPGDAAGVLPGSYRVWVDYRAPDPDPNQPIPPGGFASPPALQAVLPKYGRQASLLTVDITAPRDDLVIRLD
jgi:hypothetical protein